MQTVQQLRENGWRFDYNDDTRFVTAAHPKGGKLSILHVDAPTHHLSNSERQALGAKIVGLLNGCECRRLENGQVEREWVCPVHGSEL